MILLFKSERQQLNVPSALSVTLKLRGYRCERCSSSDTQVTREVGLTTYRCNNCGLVIRKRRVKQCPSCGSLELYFEAGMITGQKYHCKKCDYVGPLVFESEVVEKSG